jgi:hypothetical protein
MTIEAFKKHHAHYVQSVYQIDDISLEDEGSYRCISENGIDKELIKEVYLTVKGNYA